MYTTISGNVVSGTYVAYNNINRDKILFRMTGSGTAYLSYDRTWVPTQLSNSVRLSNDDMFEEADWKGPILVSFSSSGETNKANAKLFVEEVNVKPSVLYTGLPVTASMLLWLESDWDLELSGTQLTKWNNRADANFNFVQTTSASKPAYRSADPRLNNQPAVYFDGSSFMSASANMSYPAAITYYVVAYPMTNGTYFELSNGTSRNLNFYQDGNDTYANMAYNTLGSETKSRTLSASLNSTFVFAATNATLNNGPSAWTIYYNGLQNQSDVAAANIPNFTAGSSSPKLGCNYNNTGNFLTGYVGAILMYSTAHDATQVDLITRYLRGKYGAGI